MERIEAVAMKNAEEKRLQFLAYMKLKEMGHNLAKESFNEDADYSAEFKSPFNQSHGLTIDDLLNPPKLVWTGPTPGCTCGGVDIERRECQGYKTCKCGKTTF